jgi:hypothetical protein
MSETGWARKESEVRAVGDVAAAAATRWWAGL